MGKECEFQLIDESAQHDPSKVCLGYEFEDDQCVMDAAVYEALTGQPLYTPCKKQADSWTVLGGPELDRLCSKCRWFFKAEGDAVLAFIDMHHCNANPILYSDFYIEKLYMGRSSRKYVDTTSPVRVITESDIDREFKTISEMKPPLRKSDVDAYEETMESLRTMKGWFRGAEEKGISCPIVVFRGGF